jgi:hypothetical protein
MLDAMSPIATVDAAQSKIQNQSVRFTRVRR